MAGGDSGSEPAGRGRAAVHGRYLRSGRDAVGTGRGLLRPPGKEGGRSMIRTVAWKEYREHRSIWLAMALAAVVGLGSLPALFVPPGGFGFGSDKSTFLMIGAAILACTYGLVCGAMML